MGFSIRVVVVMLVMDIVGVEDPSTLVAVVGDTGRVDIVVAGTVAVLVRANPIPIEEKRKEE